MENELIKTKEIGDYRIKIYYDTYAACPVSNYDMGARYLFEYNDRYHHRLHKECNWSDWFSDNEHSLEDALRRMTADVVEQKDIIDFLKRGKIHGLRFVYNSHERQWELQYKCECGIYRGQWITDLEIDPSELKVSDFRQELAERLETDDLIALIENCAKDFVIKEWSSTGYSQGDYLYGVAYMSKERYDKMVGSNGKPWKEHAIELIDLEVKEIGMWAWGDVKGFVLQKKVPYTKHYHDNGREDVEDFDWQEVGSCWGFYMEEDELIKEVISEYNLECDDK